MGMPNASVWGDWSTWRDVRILSVTGDGNIDIKALKPRINIFNTDTPNYTQCSLSRAVQTGVVTANQQIDNSICVCGQHPDISPYAHIGLFTNHQNADDNKTPDNIWIEENQINWFFGEVDAAHHTLRNHLINRTNATEKWSPEATNSGENNTNYYINPYTYYQFKSIFLQLKVDVITGYDGNNCPLFTQYSLNEWKTSHSDKKICGFTILPCGYDSYTNNIIYYGTSNSTPMNDQCVTACIMNAVDGVVDYATYCNNRNISFDVIGRCVTNYYDTSSTFYMTGFDMFDGQAYKAASFTNTDTGWYVWTEIPYTAENYEKLLKMGALFGCPFTDTNKYSFDINFLDNDLYLPVIPADGISLGEYTHGVMNATNDLYDATTIRDINYNPDTPVKPHDPNTYSITTGFNTVGNVASTTKAYVVNADALNGLSAELWSIVDNLIVNPSDIDNLYNMSLDTFLTNNPIDAIVSVKKFPLDHVPHGETLTNVYLGKYATGAAGYELAAQQLTYNFKGIPIFPKFGDCFLDYAPYTKMQLYVPFCGTIDIDAADFMGRTLSVEMAMDFITGNVTAYVLANQLVITSLTGTCAIDIPITGTEQATVSSAYESAAISERQARKSEIVQGANVIMHPIKTAFNPVDKMGERTGVALDRAKAQYDLTHIQIPLRQIGQASPLNSWALEFVCRLIIYYPDGECIQFNATNEPTLIDEKVKQFGAVNGFATVETGTLSSYSGFTQISEIDLTGVTATETEKDMIINLLVNGVYL